MKKLRVVLLIIGILCLVLGVVGYDTMKNADTSLQGLEKRMADQKVAWAEDKPAAVELVDEFLAYTKVEAGAANVTEDGKNARAKLANFWQAKVDMKPALMKLNAAIAPMVAHANADAKDTVKGLVVSTLMAECKDADVCKYLVEGFTGFTYNDAVSKLTNKKFKISMARNDLIDAVWVGHVRKLPELVCIYSWKYMAHLFLVGAVLVCVFRKRA